MNLLKKRDSSEKSNNFSDRWEMIRAAGEALIKEMKPKQPTNVANTKPFRVFPESTEISSYNPITPVETGDIAHEADDYVPQVHELTRAAEREVAATEAVIVDPPNLRTIISSENMPITVPTGLNIVAIHDDLDRIYREQGYVAPDIPTS